MAVAWSGGIDSTALLLALKQQGYDVHAWHIDHGWHPQSKQCAQHLKHLAHTWQIPFLKSHFTGIGASNKEAESRRLRYQQFVQWSEEQAIHTLATAHHADDQAETICMRLLQGAGIRGCRGMAYSRRMGDMQLIRPLLHIPKSTLETALQQANVPWYEDASNLDTSFLRNRIRHQLLPSMKQHHPKAEQLFVRLAKHMQILDQNIEDLAQVLTLHTTDHEVYTAWQPWLQLSPAVRAYVMRHMFEKLLGHGKTPGKRHLQLIERWLAQDGKGGLDLSGSRLSHQGEHLHLRRVIDILRNANKR